MSFVETAILKNSTIIWLYSDREEILINPDYQRMGGIWTLEKRQLLIDSILNDYDLPKIYFHEYTSKQVRETGYKYAVIDGRQRLETIWGFLDGDFNLSDEFEYQRDPSLDLSGLSYNDLATQHPKIKIKFDSFVLPVVTVSIDGDDIDLIEDMFSRLNEAVPLNAAEKRNAFGGPMVKAISEIADHSFFKSRVRFSNSRFQHKEVAARMLLIEDSLRRSKRIVDTKKVYLDAMARSYQDRGNRIPSILKNRVKTILDLMNKVFSPKDELLMAQGNMAVYYLLFRFAKQDDRLDEISRRRLLDFREKLKTNRELAINKYTEASYELLEYDRLSQQGTNDASNIKERYSVLAQELGLKAHAI